MSDTHIQEVLTHLNQIGASLNRLGGGDASSVQPTLSLIVESATKVLPGSSAVIYTYNESKQEFEPESRVSAEKHPIENLDDAPRPNGIGRRAVSEQRRVLSYEESNLDINPAKIATGARVMACYPLMVAGEVLGTLYIYLHEDRTFSDTELSMLENFVNLTAMALSLARQLTLAQQEQSRKERELRRLRRAGILLSSRSSLKDTLEAILDMAMEVTDALYGIFRLVDKSCNYLVTQAIAGDNLGQPAVEILPINENSIMGMVALRREPVVISDLRQDPWRLIYYPFDHKLTMRSEVTVPLIGASGRLEGVLNLESPQLNAFTRQDRYILQILATQAVVAIQEARLLDTLQEVSALLAIQPIHDVHNVLVERACDLLNIPMAVIWLTENDNLVIQSASDELLVGKSIPVANNRIGSVIHSGQLLSIDDASFESQFDTPELCTLNGRGTSLHVPLLTHEGNGGTPVGVFSVFTHSMDIRDFEQSDWDKKVLEILAHYAALAVQNAIRLEALRTAQERHTTNEAFAAVGDIAANLLHRLNNKIGTIPVRVEGIQDKCQSALQTDAYLESNLNEIQRSAEEAMQVVSENLFHLHPIQLTPVSAAVCVQESINSLSLPAGIVIQCINLDSLPAVQAGQKRLPLVISNLLENAADAMQGEGTITISGDVQDRWVELSIHDTGPGIPAEQHERIFEFNYSSRSTHPRKLGFGLWWVKSLMARFGGSVSIQSDGINGTTFFLNLPIARGESG